jgi:hypothetical protein
MPVLIGRNRRSGLWKETCTAKAHEEARQDIQYRFRQKQRRGDRFSRPVRGQSGIADEGQSFEAEAIAGVENAPDPDVAEVHTRQVPEDDVPPEYQNQDR